MTGAPSDGEASATSSDAEEDATDAPSFAGIRLLVGTYTATSGGSATGLVMVEADSSGRLASRTVAVVDDPSFLAVAGDRVYAVSETVDGRVHAFRRSGGGALEHLWSVTSGGRQPCHIRIDASGALVVTNYGGGTVVAIDAEAADRRARNVTSSKVRHDHGDETRFELPDAIAAIDILPAATGPVPERQDGSHPHQSVGGLRGTVLVPDLGGDTIHEYRIGADVNGAGLERIRAHALPPGTGPRHMAWYGEDLLVCGELDGQVYRLRADGEGTLRVIEQVGIADAQRAVRPGPSADDAGAGADAGVGAAAGASAAAGVGAAGGQGLPSHLEVDESGRVTVAVRGRDTIAVLDAAGPLRLVAEVDCGGVWPRHFARVDDFLIVANERSSTVAVLPLNADGIPGAPVAQVAVGTPTCIVPVPAD